MKTKTKHAFHMPTQDLRAQIEQVSQEKEEKSEAWAKKLPAATDAKGEMEDTIITRDGDIKNLKDLTATCEQKGRD